MEAKRLRRMVYKIFKAPNNLNPIFMNDIFRYSPNIRSQNTTKFGNKSLSKGFWCKHMEHIARKY